MTVLFTTPRLQVRAWTLADRAAYHDILSRPEIARYDDFSPIDLAEADADLARILADYTRPDRDEYEYAVVRTSDGLVIGCLHAHALDAGRSERSIGYHFHPAAQGQGYAIEAVRGWVDWLHADGGTRVTAIVDTRNQRSILLLAKAGFAPTGSLGRRQVKGEDIEELGFVHLA